MEKTMGPVQLMVFGFQDGKFSGKIMQELRAAEKSGAVRLVDLRFVNKDMQGNVTGFEASGLTPEEKERFGAIVGSLIEVGRGKWPISRLQEVLFRRDRRSAGPTAPPQGLFLLKVRYETDLAMSPWCRALPLTAPSPFSNQQPEPLALLPLLIDVHQPPPPAPSLPES